jgi:hypothetical protein
VCGQPTDWDLLNRCRRESERLIDVLCKKSGLGVEPRTHRATQKAVWLTMLTTFGVHDNEYARRLVQKSLTMNVLFN